jgi:ribulose-phosphate 3-epimerase
VHISASLLSADLLNIGAEIKALINAKINSFHIDIMDGHFVPNIAFGIDATKQISKISTIPISIHLMVNDPLQFIDALIYPNVEYIIIHCEICGKIEKIFEKIKANGVKIGIAINPQTEIFEIHDYLKFVDLALVMGVQPGFSGQKLMTQTLNKIKQIKSIRNDVIVGIDGGIDDKTAVLANKEKADILVVGSYLFDGVIHDKVDNVRMKLKNLCQYG